LKSPSGGGRNPGGRETILASQEKERLSRFVSEKKGCVGNDRKTSKKKCSGGIFDLATKGKKGHLSMKRGRSLLILRCAKGFRG